MPTPTLLSSSPLSECSEPSLAPFHGRFSGKLRTCPRLFIYAEVAATAAEAAEVVAAEVAEGEKYQNLGWPEA